MNPSKEFLRSNIELIEKWGAFVEVSQQNGESPQSVRTRLAANNLTPEQIDMLMDRGSEVYYKNVVRARNTKWYLIGIPLLIAGPVLMPFEMVVLPHRFPVAGIACVIWGLRVLAKIKGV